MQFVNNFLLIVQLPPMQLLNRLYCNYDRDLGHPKAPARSDQDKPLSQKEIAERLHVDSSTITRYMRDDKFPSIDTFANICEILDVSSDEILGLK